MQTTARLQYRHQPTLIDRTAVLDRVGGDHELLRDITAIFLAEYPALLGEIQEAVAARDAKSTSPAKAWSSSRRVTPKSWNGRRIR